MAGGGKSAGAAELEIQGGGTPLTVPLANGQSLQDGTYEVALDRPALQEGRYGKIVGRWNLGGMVFSGEYSLNPEWVVLGVVHHTQYNTPSEAACPEILQQAWVFDRDCNFEQVELRKKFAAQVYINGTGASISNGLLKYSNKCKGSRPDGANDRNAFLKVNSITGSCNKQLEAGFQAVYPNPVNAGAGDLPCGKGTLLVKANNVNRTTGTVEDYCPACIDGHHIDNYSDVVACSAADVGDLGIFWTATMGVAR